MPQLFLYSSLVGLAASLPMGTIHNGERLISTIPGMESGHHQSGETGATEEFSGEFWGYVVKGMTASLTSPTYLPEDGESIALSVGVDGNGLRLASLDFQFNQETGTLEASEILDTPVLFLSRNAPQGSLTITPWIEHDEPLAPGSSVGVSLIADYYRKPPEPSGNLGLSKHLIRQGETVTVSWSFDRGDDLLTGKEKCLMP